MAYQDTEYDVPDVDAPLRQGDLLVFPSLDGSQAWDQIAVVLTADCDLAWGASRGLVTIVPAVTIETYVKHVWAEKKIRRLRYASLTTCKQMLSKARGAETEALTLSDEAVESWILSATVDEICAQRGITEEKDRSSLAIHHDVVRRAGQDFGLPPRECMSLLCELRALVSRSQSDAEATKIMKQASSELQELPQDVFYISSLPGIGDSGFFILLRDLRHFPVNQVTPSLSEAKENPGKAFRAARLRPVFKYSLIQQFALLFLRIGLPQPYQDAYKTKVGSLALENNA